MQPDFSHVVMVVMVVGLLVFLIGGAGLLLAFRAFGSARRGDIRHIVLLVASLAFILVSCVALLIWTTLQK